MLNGLRSVAKDGAGELVGRWSDCVATGCRYSNDKYVVGASHGKLSTFAFASESIDNLNSGLIRDGDVGRRDTVVNEFTVRNSNEEETALDCSVVCGEKTFRKCNVVCEIVNAVPVAVDHALVLLLIRRVFKLGVHELDITKVRV